VRVLLRSTEDPASMNIAGHFADLVRFTPEGTFEGHPIMRNDGWALVTSGDPHITNEGIDRRIAEAMGEPIDLLVFLSRHRSESGRRSLTVHPPGNPGGADFGGDPGFLAPVAPHAMTTALRRLNVAASGLDYAVTFEVTHHGPRVEVPAFFIEIGSTGTEWTDPRAGAAVARAVAGLMDAIEVAPVVLIGIGGGHYAPRFTDVALSRRVSFGHMIPSYHLGILDRDLVIRAVGMSGADGAYVHRKALKGGERARVMALLEEADVRVYREGDLEPG